MAMLTGAGVASAGDADPRPDPVAGTQPNPNVPTVSTGALGDAPFNERDELPTGHWIRHNNGWIFKDPAKQNMDHIREFANKSVQRFIIDGEEFVLDEFGDWDYQVTDDGVPRLRFEYVTPPKRKGKTYEIRWEFESEQFDRPSFPWSNEVEVVGRH